MSTLGIKRISPDAFARILAEGSIGDPAAQRDKVDRKTSHSNLIADRITRLVQVGNLRAGDILPIETVMSEALGVSRPVLREALKMLSVLGLIGSRQGGAHVVTDLRPETLIRPVQFLATMDDYDPRVHYEARVVIDAELTRLAASRASRREAAQILDLARRGAGLENDPVAFRLHDFDFHMAVNEAADNILLMRMSQALYELGLEWRRMASGNPANVLRSLAEHLQIANAIVDRNPDAADAAQRVHVDSILKTTLQAKEQTR